MMKHLKTAAAHAFVIASIAMLTTLTIAAQQSPTPPKAPFQTLTAAQESALKLKDMLKECDDCPEMVVVPAGSFTMGSPLVEDEHDDNEGPLHRVTFARPLAVGKFAVTFVEWDACVGDGGCGGYRPPDEGWGRNQRPVINVSWDDAKAYAAWLSKKTGKIYRLLSEAEREYVTRAGTSTPFWFGATISTGLANYDGRSTYASGVKGEHREQTNHPDRGDNPASRFRATAAPRQ